MLVQTIITAETYDEELDKTEQSSFFIDHNNWAFGANHGTIPRFTEQSPRRPQRITFTHQFIDDIANALRINQKIYILTNT